MSLPRFFLDEQVLSAEAQEEFTLRFDPDDAKHCAVLRLAPGEHIAVIDAQGDYFACCITGFDGKLPRVRIASRAEGEGRAPLPFVVVAQGLAKADRFEMVIRHATELGVGAFIPFASRRCVVRIGASKEASKLARWRTIAKSAAMQSGQPAIPQIAEVMDAAQLASWAQRARCALICWEEADFTQTVHEALSGFDAVSFTKEAPLLIVIGPEGGIDEAEVEALLSCNGEAHVVSLGASILRTETAGIVAPALALYELGYLGGSR